MPWTTKALQTYLAVALQIYGAMLSVYWAAQFIPSGWLSVIFGLTPMMTAIMAAIWLDEQSLGPVKLISYGTGFIGLLVMFGSAIEIGREAVLGIGAVVISAFLQSASSVLIKRIDAKLPAVFQVTGGLLLAVPVYLGTWLWLDGAWPASLPLPSLVSIAYLGIIATTVGFALYSHEPARYPGSVNYVDHAGVVATIGTLGQWRTVNAKSGYRFVPDFRSLVVAAIGRSSTLEKSGFSVEKIMNSFVILFKP